MMFIILYQWIIFFIGVIVGYYLLDGTIKSPKQIPKLLTLTYKNGLTLFQVLMFILFIGFEIGCVIGYILTYFIIQLSRFLNGIVIIKKKN